MRKNEEVSDHEQVAHDFQESSLTSAPSKVPFPWPSRMNGTDTRLLEHTDVGMGSWIVEANETKPNRDSLDFKDLKATINLKL